MKDSDIIAAATPLHESTCACDQCAGLCRYTPCLGTPSDVLRLIGDGLGEHFTPTLWAAGNSVDLPEIPMIAIRALPCGACPLLREGLCTIHAKKPTSGRLASAHSRVSLYQSPDVAVALTWLSPRNIRIIETLFRYFKIPTK